MAKSETSPEVVCDAGPLIHLDELDCLDLLSDFRAVYVPEQVWQEVEQHQPGALSQPGRLPETCQSARILASRDY